MFIYISYGSLTARRARRDTDEGYVDVAQEVLEETPPSTTGLSFSFLNQNLVRLSCLMCFLELILLQIKYNGVVVDRTLIGILNDGIV